MDSIGTDAIIGMIIGGFVTFCFITLAVYILIIIGYWKIFTKAGEPGWKSIIPIYNLFTQYKLTWKTYMIWPVIICYLGGSALDYYFDGALSIIGSLLMLAGAIIMIVGQHKLSKAFGHGVGFTLGLIFLTPIFLMVLGFGSSRYEGNRA